MGVETEVKYLVAPNWKDELGANDIKSVKEIKQGYLSTDPQRTVRVRTLTEDGVARAYITVKGPRVGLSSPEFEYNIPYPDAVEMLGLCVAVLEKTRHVVETEQGQSWEVDVFHGLNDGLILGELELEEGEELMFVPGWAYEDVSFDNRYTNAQLLTNRAPCLLVD